MFFNLKNGFFDPTVTMRPLVCSRFWVLKIKRLEERKHAKKYLCSLDFFKESKAEEIESGVKVHVFRGNMIKIMVKHDRSCGFCDHVEFVVSGNEYVGS